jgi:hypothetical protein
MGFVVALVIAGVGMVVATIVAVRLIAIGNLDALELASKIAVPFPATARDWPELRIDAVLPSPAGSEVLLAVRWPGRPENRSVLVVTALDDPAAGRYLTEWCDTRASLSPTPHGTSGLDLRRRRTFQRVELEVLSEDLGRMSPA